MYTLCVCVLVAQSCPTLCDPMDCSPPGSSVQEIFQARTLEWVAISFSRGSSQPRDWTQVSYTAGRFFTDWAPREAHVNITITIHICIYTYIYIHTHTYVYILSSLSWQLMWKYKHFLIMIFKIKSFGNKVGSLTLKWEGKHCISIITWWDTCPFLLPNIHMLLLVGRKPFCMSLVESHLSFHLSL